MVAAIKHLLQLDKQLKIRVMATQFNLPICYRILTIFKKKLFKRRSRLSSKKLKLLHNTAILFSVGKSKASLEKHKWKVIQRPSCRHYLALSDFFSFGPLKNSVKGRIFRMKKEGCGHSNRVFQKKCATYFRDGIL